MDPNEILERKLSREKAARLEAERLLEDKSRELFDQKQQLEKLNSTLESRVSAGTLKLQRSNAMLMTLHKVVLMAAEVETFDEALERCLNAICQLSAWPLGHIYKRVTGSEDVLLPSGIWVCEKPDLFQKFREATELTKFHKGVGLPGRIWDTGTPVWIDDVSCNSDFTRGDTETEVKCGFGFPVKIKGRVAAVLELFNDEACERDEQLLRLLDSVGEQVGRVLERQEALREQRQAREEADRANEAKSRFLANMSHEIRTPMNAILGLTELVLDSNVTKTQHDYLSTVMASGESLLSLVNDILDLSKIEADAVTLERAVVNLHELAFSTVKSMSTQAHIKGLELLCSIASDVPEFIRGDRIRIQQVLINLLGNAIKFTQQGEVELKVFCSEADSGDRELNVLVRDTGIGISDDKQESVFREFEQADDSTTRQFGGTGLGLSIVQRLVQLMGGRIEIESKVGKGSELGFVLSESCYETEAMDANIIQREFESIYEPPDSVRLASLGGIHVLAVDANLRHQELLCEWVERVAGKGCMSSSLDEVPAMLKRDEIPSGKVDFIFLDAKCLGDGGFESLQDFSGQFEDSTRFLLMLDASMHWTESQLPDALKGCCLVRKPLNYSEFCRTLCDLRWNQQQHGESVVSTVHASPIPRNGLKVLVVEDSIVNQKLAAAMLKKLGHEVAIANNGKEALEAIKQSVFDLVLMDIQMPELDGYETVRQLRKDETDERLPVIALTANAMRTDREACLEAGMDAYVSKPIRLKKLAEIIQDVCFAK